jgi:hypothetical protein
MPDRAMQLPIAVCTSTPSRIAECRTVAVEAFAGVVSRIERAGRFVRCRLSNSAASCAPPVLTSNPEEKPMVITAAHITPLVAIVAGILILIVPRLLNYIVAIYLIVIGCVELNSIHHFVNWH